MEFIDGYAIESRGGSLLIHRSTVFPDCTGWPTKTLVAERRIVALCALVQKRERFGVTFPSREIDGAASLEVDRGSTRPAIEQHLDRGGIVVPERPCGIVKWRESGGVDGVKVRAQFDQCAGGLEVTFTQGEHQWRLAGSIERLKRR